MSLLKTRDLCLSRDGHRVLAKLNLTVGPGECIGLIGPNGAGKTTLMRAALGLIKASGYSSLAALSPAARAAAVAWLPQSRDIAWPVTVAHLVGLGAQARGRPADHSSVAAAIKRMGLPRYEQRVASRLSGGEQARVLIARALAQDCPLLMADEPIAGLDPEQQIRTMAMLRELSQEGRSVVVSLHDLGLAARYCTRLILLQDGEVMADGTPDVVLSQAHLAAVFGVRAFRADSADGLVIQPMQVVR